MPTAEKGRVRKKLYTNACDKTKQQQQQQQIKIKTDKRITT